MKTSVLVAGGLCLLLAGVSAFCNTRGLLVQYVSGQSYEEYVKQHIFVPLD